MCRGFDMLRQVFFPVLLLSLSGCGGIESQQVDFDTAKENPLLVPPCVESK